MKKWIVYFQLLALSLFLAACSNQPQRGATAKKPSDKNIAWQQRQTKFSKIREWRLQGKASVRYQSDNWPFSLSWLQRQGEDYEMNIKHPLTGRVLAYIKSTNQGVMLKGQDGKIYRDRNAENLVKTQLRVALPLKGMKSWVLGIASPNYPAAKVTLDDYGRPITLLQAGWRVDYPAYATGGAYAFPEKIILQHLSDNTRIKLIVKDWQARY